MLLLVSVSYFRHLISTLLRKPPMSWHLSKLLSLVSFEALRQKPLKRVNLEFGIFDHRFLLQRSRMNVLVQHFKRRLPCPPANLSLCKPRCIYLWCCVRLLCWHDKYGKVCSSTAGCNSRSPSRAGLERRDLQDLQDPPELQGQRALMEPLAQQWVHFCYSDTSKCIKRQF